MTADRMHNESALVCAARAGDKEALQVLLAGNWTWLKGVVYSVLAGPQDLDDVMQEVCLRVITRIHTLRDPQRFRAWLAVLARHEALKCRRRKARRAGTQDPASPGRDAATGLEPQDNSVDEPGTHLERRELCARVLDAVQRLPEKYREVFVLAHTGEMTYAQIAEVLDIPVTTMQIRLVRARRMIRDRVAGKSEQGSGPQVRYSALGSPSQTCSPRSEGPLRGWASGDSSEVHENEYCG